MVHRPTASFIIVHRRTSSYIDLHMTYIDLHCRKSSYHVVHRRTSYYMYAHRRTSWYIIISSYIGIRVAFKKFCNSNIKKNTNVTNCTLFFNAFATFISQTVNSIKKEIFCLSLLLQELVEDVAVVTSFHHLDLS